jgi:hypothetical protein
VEGDFSSRLILVLAWLVFACVAFWFVLRWKRSTKNGAPMTAPIVEASNLDPIRDRLRLYPVLYRVLGDAWLDKQVAIHPSKSTYALARWLRIEGYEPRLQMLDRLLAMFEDSAGAKEHRDRISGDAPSLEATIVELHFAGWLRENGITFEMPNEGADFLVALPGGGILPVEVTAPRRSVWFDDLFDRLVYIKRGSGFALRWGFHEEDLPDHDKYSFRLDDVLTDTIANQIIDDALTNMASIKNDPSDMRTRFLQVRPEVGYRAEWWLNDSEYMSGNSGAGTPLAYGPWWQILNAARKKTQKTNQLPSDRTNGLLVGANQLEDRDLGNWADWVQRNQDNEVPIQWRDKSSYCREDPSKCRHFPDQVKYVFLYKFSWRELEPQCALLIINTASRYPDVPGFDAFRQRMFPIPYRPVSSRHIVWASTDRCFNRRWF